MSRIFVLHRIFHRSWNSSTGSVQSNYGQNTDLINRMWNSHFFVNFIDCFEIFKIKILWNYLSQKNVEAYVQDCYDSIAMFLCIQLILRFQILCHKRCVPALDKWVLFIMFECEYFDWFFSTFRADIGIHCKRRFGPDLSSFFGWTSKVYVIVIRTSSIKVLHHIMWVQFNLI